MRGSVSLRIGDVWLKATVAAPGNRRCTNVAVFSHARAKGVKIALSTYKTGEAGDWADGSSETRANGRGGAELTFYPALP